MRSEKSRGVRNILFKKKKSLWSPVNRKRRRNVQLNMLADFLSNRLSAAGVSHVVKAPSAFRRFAWGIIILVTAVVMALMTYRVLQEYLAYPTIMRSMSTSASELEFPAVTFCGMSQVPKAYAKEAGLHYMEEMKTILSSLPRYTVPEEERTMCLKDPLCYWSWFDDVCLCSKNPCDTLYCYPDIDMSDHKCACSMLLCLWKGSQEACHQVVDEFGVPWCECNTNFTYPRALEAAHRINECNEEHREKCKREDENKLPKEFVESLDIVDPNPQIRSLWENLKSSRTKDLRDVERFFVPPVGVMDDYGFPADSFILSCNFGFRECTGEHLVTLYTAGYGKCYMFNYIGDELVKKSDVRKVSQPGKQYGLQIFLRSNSNDSLPLLTRQLGIRLIIHDPRSIPLTDDGIDIRPGDMTSIKLKAVQINRLKSPWGTCADDGQTLGNYTRDPYNQNDCERECVNMEVFKSCGCYHPKYLRATTLPRRGNICLTNLTAHSNGDECFTRTMAKNDAGEIKCDCPPPCRQKDYEISMSTSKLNDEFFKMVRTAKSLSMKNGTPAVLKGDFGTNLMGVQIYYNDLFVTNNEETAIYSWESLVANVGGNMGLFLGLSLVTLLEIAEFFADMIYNVIARRKSRPHRVKDTIVPYTY